MQKTVNTRILMLREYLNQTQQDFAALVGLTATQLSRIENGEGTPQRGTLQKIINSTGVNPDWLLSGKGELQTHAVSVKAQSDNPWKDEAYNSLKSELSYIKEKYDQLLEAVLKGGSLGKYKAIVKAARNFKKDRVPVVR